MSGRRIMSLDWLVSGLPYVLQFLITLFVAVVTANITVRLSLKQFYEQKWWERKMEAYSAIIDSLHHMKRCLEDWYDEAVGEGIMGKSEVPEEHAKAQSRRFKEASDELKRRTDIGGLSYRRTRWMRLRSSRRCWILQARIPTKPGANKWTRVWGW
jgi:hypothetical protein